MTSNQKAESAAVPVAAPSAKAVRRRFVLLLSLLIAGWFPSPVGSWMPISILLWGLVGDPNGFWDAARCVLFGGGMLAAYAAIVFMALRYALKAVGVAVKGRHGVWRAAFGEQEVSAAQQ
jgi:hypothetical protein